MLALYHKSPNFVLPSIFAPKRRSGFYVGLRGDRRKPVHCASKPGAERQLDYLDAQVTAARTAVAS